MNRAAFAGVWAMYIGLTFHAGTPFAANDTGQDGGGMHRGSTPFYGTPLAIPGTIQAADFDNGGEGIAYHDTTPGNSGGAYRQGDVDIEASAEGGYDVGWIADGEWLTYTVDVAASGPYDLQFRVASPFSSGRLHLSFSGSDTSVVAVPNTGGWQIYRTVTIPATLTAGPQQIRLIVDTGGFNISRVTLARGSAGPKTITVPADGDLQAAINGAELGDTILLAAGATFVGNFVLPAKNGSGVITIRSGAPDVALPDANSRIDPSFAALLPKLRSPNGAPALATAPGAHHYTLLALEFRANFQGLYDILTLGDGSPAQNTLELVPHDLVVDRCYVHGDPIYGQKRGIALNSASTTITNSYVADIKAIGQDSQAVGGWNGPGPYTITNNYLEAAGENLMFGGADPAIPDLVPSDITIRHNHLAKQLTWRSQNWVVKNLFELKNAQRVVVDGNVMEYNWLAGQTGYAVLFTPRNQDGGCPWCVVQHIQFTNNLVRHTASGINILGADNIYPSGITNDITIRNNLFEDVRGAVWGGQGRFMMIGDGSVNVVVDHNTVLQDGLTALAVYGAPTQNFVFTSNILPDFAWAIFGDGVGIGNAAIAVYFPGSQFLSGIFAGSNPVNYPAGNYYPNSLADVGFVNLERGNYRLAPRSPYRYRATDGTNVGCDIDALNAAARIHY